METRVLALEHIAEKTAERLEALALDVAVIKSNYATKADIAELKARMDAADSKFATKADMLEMKNSIVMWVVSAFFLAQLLPALLKKFGLS